MNLSKADTMTVAKIVGNKANEMYKKGAMWLRGGKTLSCVDMGKLANKILKSVSPDEKFLFEWEKKATKPKPVKNKTAQP